MITPRWAALFAVSMLLLLATGCADDDDGPSDPQPLPGTVIVTVDPDSVAAPWTLAGPEAGAWSGTGSLLLDGMDPGEYTIVWGNVAGYQTPDTTSQSLAEADTLTLVGRYAPPVATSPDILIANFNVAYSLSDLGLYRSVLSADFRFITGDETEYDLDRELEVSARIFSGAAGDGGIAISDITIVRLQPLDAWEAIPEDDPYFGGYPGGVFRPYDVLINFRVANQNLVLQVQGLVIFYAIPLPGQDPTIYELLGIVDHTYGKTENHSWGAVKSLFD